MNRRGEEERRGVKCVGKGNPNVHQPMQNSLPAAAGSIPLTNQMGSHGLIAPPPGSKDPPETGL